MAFHVTSFFCFWGKIPFWLPVGHPPVTPCLFYTIAGRLALIGTRVGTAILFSSACFKPLFFILR